MYIDDYGNEYETIKDAKKAFEKEFDESLNDVTDFSEILIGFSDFADVLEILYNKDKTILNTLKKHYSKKIAKYKKEYIEDKLCWGLEEI